jgi:hypothetical protein
MIFDKLISLEGLAGHQKLKLIENLAVYEIDSGLMYHIIGI